MTSQRIAALDLPVADSMRAPGEAIGLLAVEQAMDELAVRLEMDPIELRLKNEPKEDPEKKVPFSTRALVPCLQDGAKRFGWDKRQSRPGQVRDGNWLIGMGVAAAIRGNFLREAEARVTMESERHAVVEMDMTDIGTGSYTVFAQIAAEVLDLPVENIKVKLGTARTPTRRARAARSAPRAAARPSTMPAPGSRPNSQRARARRACRQPAR